MAGEALKAFYTPGIEAQRRGESTSILKPLELVARASVVIGKSILHEERYELYRDAIGPLLGARSTCVQHGRLG